ncbi:MAG: hypothetical protein RML94_08715 [Bacteroidia bacterium]|nr:hypothetical protein [Bacteroidia bacterium]
MNTHNKVFILILSTQLTLLLCAWLFSFLPANSIFKYPTLNQWLIPEKDSTESYAHKLALLQQDKKPKNQIIPSKISAKDSTHQKQKKLAVKDTNTYTRDTSEYAKRIALINPKDASGNSAMDNFFKVLEQMEYTQNAIHIAHYGDSQLMKGRISHDLGLAFQQQYGGSGPGYVAINDLTDVYPNRLVKRSKSSNWVMYGITENPYLTNNYGIGGVHFRFSPPKESVDTTQKLDFNRYKAYITFETTEKFWKEYINFNRISLLYGNAQVPCSLTVKIDDEPERQVLLKPTTEPRILHFATKSGHHKVTLSFSAQKSPDIYGIYLNDSTGFHVGCYGISGHGGHNLKIMNPDILTKQLKLTNTKLVILEYGGNVVAHMHDHNAEKIAQKMEDIYYETLMMFKRILPEASIIFIGVQDMAHKVDGKYQSYKHIRTLLAAQKRAAERAGVAFWDLFKMMGEEGSIVYWQEKARPYLAFGDYMHFSWDGGKLIAESLFKAIMNEYAEYKMRKMHKSY